MTRGEETGADRRVQLAELTYPEVQALLADPRPTVLLLPVSATEPHGPHAPLATDSIIAAGMCRRAAEQLADDPQLRALVLPALPYGVTRYAAAFPGAIGIDEATLQAVVTGVCRSALSVGFPHLAVVNCHFEPEHVRTLHRTVEALGSEHAGAIGFVDLTRRRHAERLTDEFRRGEAHAGCYETSLVLADHPRLVDAAVAADLPAVPVDMPAAMAEGRTDFLAMGMDDAYCGAPAEATAAEGEATFATLAGILVESLRALVDGTGGRDLPGRAR